MMHVRALIGGDSAERCLPLESCRKPGATQWKLSEGKEPCGSGGSREACGEGVPGRRVPFGWILHCKALGAKGAKVTAVRHVRALVGEMVESERGSMHGGPELRGSRSRNATSRVEGGHSSMAGLQRKEGRGARRLVAGPPRSGGNDGRASWQVEIPTERAEVEQLRSPNQEAFARLPGISSSSTAAVGASSSSARKMGRDWKKPDRKATLSEGLRRRTEEIDQLRDTVHSLQAQVDHQRDMLTTKDAEIKRRQTQLLQLQASLSPDLQLQKHQSAVTAELRKAEHQVSRLKNELLLSEKQLLHIRELLKAKGEEVSRVKLQLASRDAQLAENKEVIAALRESLTQVKSDLEHSRASPEETSGKQVKRHSPQSISKLAQEQALQLEQASAQKRELEARVADLRNTMLETENEQITIEKSHKRELEVLGKELREKDDQIAKYMLLAKQAQMNFEQRAAKAEKKLESSRAQAAELRGKLKERAKVDLELDARANRIERLEKELAGSSIERASARDSWDKERRRLVSQLEAECCKTTSLSRHLNEAIAAKNKQEDECKALEAVVSTSSEAMRKLREQADSDAEARRHAEEALDKIEMSHRDNVAQLEDQLAEARAQLAAATDRAETNARVFKQNRDALSLVEQDLQRANEALQASQKTVQELENKLTSKVDEARTREELEVSLATAQEELARFKIRVSEVEMQRVTAHKELEDSRSCHKAQVERFESEIARLQAEMQHRSRKSDGEQAEELARVSAELNTEIVRWRGKASGLESALRDKEQDLQDKASQLELFHATLRTSTDDVSNLQETVAALQSKAREGQASRAKDTKLQEQLAAQRAVHNLRLLLKSADLTEATTHLEFSQIKEKFLEQRLQILTYNVTACESHMVKCDPTATAKQQEARQRRMDELDNQLRQSISNRDDYLKTSATNRTRLEHLLREAQERLDIATAPPRQP
ncbi:Laminin subunit beta-2 [Durusdinium trenchii]|uniref:Laminin subunit beta-2 n=1 Tax=Durusdinium trenchii TaxID=1381693 RepID=A0ABP0LE56_9DINO